MFKLLWLIPILPLLGAAFNGLLGRQAGKALVSVVAVGTVTAAFALSLWAFLTMTAAPGQRLEAVYGSWMAVDALNVPFGLVLDHLSGLMALVITGIGALIHLYSVGYMASEEGYARYFAYLNLFVFFMLTLVLGSSLPLIFVGWEGVGLCSYLLIGYYFGTDYAPAAGLKAFLFNRVGDLGMGIGMMALFAAFGTLTVSELIQKSVLLSPEVGFGVLTFATLMLFVGATGKSAQLPLYLWLPDAMAGPTPVSALIHAATMVTAGIYLLCRLGPLFHLAPLTLNVVAWVGGATALFAATIGLTQRDIKKILAYSTVSQLGFMFVGLGAGGFAAGFYHLFTHAFFKALLFLGAGSVIHAMHHEQDIFRMGGLRTKLPWTFWTMLIGTACIIGFPGTSGFASKDEILYLAFEHSPLLWAVGVLAACCTSFYMLRLLVLTFLGRPRDAHAFDNAHHPPQADRAASASADGGGEHSEPTGHRPVHESPLSMVLPLVVLAAGALGAVVLGWPEAFGGSYRIGHLLAPIVAAGAEPVEATGHGLAQVLAAITTVLGLGVAAFSWYTYRDGLARAEAWAARAPWLHGLLLNKYYVDEGVEAGLLRPVRALGTMLWKAADVVVIDGLGVTLWPALAQVAGHLVSLFQTGRVRNYALAMTLGLVGLLWIFCR
jgi:NADH-quinone oxidoreductase subunit L